MASARIALAIWEVGAGEEVVMCRSGERVQKARRGRRIRKAWRPVNLVQRAPETTLGNFVGYALATHWPLIDHPRKRQQETEPGASDAVRPGNRMRLKAEHSNRGSALSPLSAGRGAALRPL